MVDNSRESHPCSWTLSLVQKMFRSLLYGVHGSYFIRLIVTLLSSFTRRNGVDQDEVEYLTDCENGRSEQKSEESTDFTE